MRYDAAADQIELDRLLLEASELREKLSENLEQRREIRHRLPKKKKATVVRETVLEELHSKYVMVPRNEFVNALMPVFGDKTFRQAAIDLNVHASTIAAAYHKLRRRWAGSLSRISIAKGLEEKTGRTPEEIAKYLHWKRGADDDQL